MNLKHCENSTPQLKELYRDAVNGSVDTKKLIEVFEKEYPELSYERIKSKHSFYLECLEVALKRFNPKWVMGEHNTWIYFDINQGAKTRTFTTQSVYDFFKGFLDREMGEYHPNERILELEEEVKTLKEENLKLREKIVDDKCPMWKKILNIKS